jgi:hypothetical protein
MSKCYTPRGKIGRNSRAKGKRHQKKIAAVLLNHFPELTDRDIESCKGGKTEEDVNFSDKAKEVYPFYTECKHRKDGTVYDWLDQAIKDQLKGDGRIVTVVHSEPKKRKDVISMYFTDFLRIVQKLNMYRKYWLDNAWVNGTQQMAEGSNHKMGGQKSQPSWSDFTNSKNGPLPLPKMVGEPNTGFNAEE